MIADSPKDSSREDQVGVSYHLNPNNITLFYLFLKEATCLSILSYGTRSHVQNLVVSTIDLVVEKTHSLMDVVGLELPHNIRFGDSTINVTYYYLFVFTP